MVSMLLLSCAEKQPEPVIAEPEPLPFEFDGNLLAIDTLLQTDAGDALQKLLSFDTQSVIFNDNYHKLLLSEALYKTDNPQDGFVETHGRASLQAAMQYFDSLAEIYPQNDDITLLSARSHYMNGVGFYESDSIVDACKEYLHALEIMENHFDVETLRGYRAKFMGLTYNRLKELFTSQFMVEPAIYCGKKSLYYCKIAPTSKYGVSNNLAKLGTLYDISDQTDSAYYYYNEALKALPDTNNLIYRDLVSSLALLSYKLGYGLQPSLEKLFYVAKHANSYDELLTRYFTIGGLYYEENIYDSAIIYLNQVFEHCENNMRQLQTAIFLMNIYTTLDDTLLINKYSNFIAKNSTSKYENSYDVSALNEMFQIYLNNKLYLSQKRNKTQKILALLLLSIITISLFIYTSKHKSKKLIKEHHRAIESERKARYREKHKMLNTIQQQENKVNALEQKLEQKRQKSDIQFAAFLDEPVCKRIKTTVNSIGVSPRVNCADYPQMKLDTETIAILDEAVVKHFPNYKQHLLSLDSKLKQNDVLLCNLYLLGLNNNQISVLTQNHYTTIFRKTKRLEQSLDDGVTLSEFLQKTAVL